MVVREFISSLVSRRCNSFERFDAHPPELMYNQVKTWQKGGVVPIAEGLVSTKEATIEDLTTYYRLLLACR